MAPASDPLPGLFEAASFAARAHRHQLRKDGETPYAAHPFRVCLVVRHVFGIEDTRVLTAALLHDTIEDTPHDYDDLAEQFGDEVAGWVGLLTKDMRLPEETREERYRQALASAPWPVICIKLADIYDNLTDSRDFPSAQRRRTLDRSASYLAALKATLPPEAERAYTLVEERLTQAWAEQAG